MKAIITTQFLVRGKPQDTYHSFPLFSTELEKALTRSLNFLEKTDQPYKLQLSIEKD